MPNPFIEHLSHGRFYLFSVLIITMLLNLSGCSTWKGADSKASTLESVAKGEADRAVIIPLFENATFEPILEKHLTQIFKETLYGHGWKVESHSATVTRVLIGQIIHFGRSPIALNAVGAARAYRVYIGLNVQLLKEEGGEVLFSMTLEGSADYIARPNAGRDRISKDRAIREAGRGMAEKLAASLQVVTSGQNQASSK